MKKLIYFLFLLFFCYYHSQQSTVASGNNISNSTGSISFSIGEVLYSSYANYSGKIFEGVQQPYEILSILEVTSPDNKNLNVIAFPNPTVNDVTIRNTNTDLKNYVYLLFDFSGKIISENKPNEVNTSLTMNKLNSGVYILKILYKNQSVKALKIIKK